MEPFAGQHVLVAGLGHSGGQVAAVRWLVEQGARVTVTDVLGAEDLVPARGALADLPGIHWRLSRDGTEELSDADLVVASPAVPDQAPVLRGARARGISITSEIALFLARCPARLVGVTGSNGKTTSAHLIASMLRAPGRDVFVAGNAGGGSLQLLARTGPSDCVVVELSSFMLERLPPATCRLQAAGITNLVPNHLDRHGTLEAYRAAKERLLEFVPPEAPLALPADDLLLQPTLKRVADRPGLGLIGTGDRGAPGAFLDASGLVLRGPEPGDGLRLRVPDGGPRGAAQDSNLPFSSWLAWRLGAPQDALQGAILDPPALAHRLEIVATLDGVTFVNDSASTTPESAVAATLAFPGRAVHLLYGGAAKGPARLDLLRRLVAACSSVQFLGAVAPALAAGLEEGGLRRPRVHGSLAPRLRGGLPGRDPGRRGAAILRTCVFRRLRELRAARRALPGPGGGPPPGHRAPGKRGPGRGFPKGTPQVASARGRYQQWVGPAALLNRPAVPPPGPRGSGAGPAGTPGRSRKRPPETAQGPGC